MFSGRKFHYWKVLTSILWHYHKGTASNHTEMGISCISTNCKIFPGFCFRVGRYLQQIQSSGEMRDGQEFKLQLRTSAIMKACPKIKEELLKINCGEKQLSSKERMRDWVMTTLQGHKGHAQLSQNQSWAKAKVEPKTKLSQNPLGWHRGWRSQLWLTAEMLPNQPQFPSCSLFCWCAQVQSLPVSKLRAGKARVRNEDVAVVLPRSSAGNRVVICFLKEAQKNQKKSKPQN